MYESGLYSSGKEVEIDENLGKESTIGRMRERYLEDVREILRMHL